MPNYRNVINPHTGKLQKVVSDDYIKSTAATLSWKPSVATIGDLPAVGNTANDARIVNANKHLYIWSSTDWTDQGELIDIVWANIDNKPNSSVENIDDTVDKKHEHSNKIELDKVTDGDHDIRTDNPHSITPSQIGAVSGIVQIFGGSTKPYVECNKTIYTIKGRVLFGGTNQMGIPKKIKIISYINLINNKGNIRLYDLTNAKVIAEVTDINSTVPIPIDMGTLSNLPTEEAIFEIQMLNQTAKKTYLNSIVVHF